MTLALFPILPLLLAADDIPPCGPAEPAPVVAVYGDSYSVGYAGIGAYEDNWSQIMGRQVGAEVVNQATGGSGYIAVAYGTTFPHQVVTRPVVRAQVVVIFGGLNDLTIWPEQERVAAVTAFAAARALNPDATVIVIGPQWPGPNIDSRMWAIRDAVAAAAAEVGVQFVDPLGGRWLQSWDLIMWDGKHPSDAGHRHLAALIGPYVAAALPARAAASQ